MREARKKEFYLRGTHVMDLLYIFLFTPYQTLQQVDHSLLVRRAMVNKIKIDI